MFLCFQWILLRRRLASTHIFWQGLLTWTGYNPMNSPLVFTITEKAPSRRSRDCLKPMNRLQLYPSSFKKTDLYSIMYNWQFEGKPSCEASYCKILVINNPIKHNRGVQSSVAARPRPASAASPAPVEAIQSSLSFSVPVTAAAI